jgi:exodeoxyribonuclease-5
MLLRRHRSYDEFDYGYVLTVHKAQGSQWDDVVLFDESGVFAESRQRWLYTGVTRAAQRLTVVM